MEVLTDILKQVLFRNFKHVMAASTIFTVESTPREIWLDS